ncbi:hypothetical protein [Roseomonas haemaphysalidis]|uniref:Uncharacterized protein n=1 Tax=Roseomonas haemaphysalidis TaxID=2768162 RepID=A0ABS3KQD4_9PROT|nr:hypothetical protein [Roseomonas haemaphysalidis]MBO1079674.1 hypothetical protein [Roseomonas haemaphysalidis]
MRKFVMLGAGLMLMGATGVALAQTAAPPPPAPQAQADTPPPPPPGGPGMRGAGGPGMRGPMGGPGPFHGGPPPSRAASFHIEKGDTELHVRCAENEPMQACVNAASALLDKVSASQPR